MLFSGVMAKWYKLGVNNPDDSGDDQGEAAGAVGSPGTARRRAATSSNGSKKKTGFLTSRPTTASATAQLLKAPRSMPTQGYKIKLGAMIVRQLIRVLPVRLPYRRQLSILGPKDELITFIPADGLEEDEKPAEEAENEEKKPSVSKKRKRADDDDDSEADDSANKEEGESPKKGRAAASKRRGASKKAAASSSAAPAASSLSEVQGKSRRTKESEERKSVIEIDETVDKRGHPYLRVVLSNDIVRDISTMLKATKGVYIFGEGDSTLMFVVTPTDIKSAIGDEIVETIGDD